MICRGGIVVGGWRSATPRHDQTFVRSQGVAGDAGRTRWMSIAAGVLVLAFVLAWLSGRNTIPPLIESDYCYLMLAANRLFDGLGLTSLQPVAPMQPWEWHYDWGFLTQWPAGYPILLAALRWVLGCTTLEAAKVVCVLGCASALVGWFALVRRCVPKGLAGFVIAALAATSCVSVSSLVNPSTDLILIAALPFILLVVADARHQAGQPYRAMLLLATAGCASGCLFWFRYASLFVPVAILAVLVIESVRTRDLPKTAGLFAFCAALPIVALIAVNSAWGEAGSAAQRFNLGSKLTVDFSIQALARCWWMYTDLGYYGHRPFVHWMIALAPLGLPLVFLVPSQRVALGAFARRLEIRLVLALAISMLGLIVGAATFFGSKFDYIGLERYYLPGRPLFVLIAFVPFLLVPARSIRLGTSAIALLFVWHTAVHEWMPTYQRWVGADRPTTPSGAWSRVFEPHAASLYAWLQEHDQDQELLVFSNFHEYLALETGLPILPLPTSIEALQDLRDRARLIRGVNDPIPIFVLNPENLWRDYWIIPPREIIEELGLQPCPNGPAELQSYLFVPRCESQSSTNMHVMESDFAALGVDGRDSLWVGPK